MSTGNSSTPVMGTKAFKMCDDIVTKSECKIDTAKAVRHFIQHEKTQNRFKSYVESKDPSYSLMNDVNVGLDFTTFKNKVETKRQVKNGATIISPSQTERINDLLLEAGLPTLKNI